MSRLLPSASARPFVTSGIAAVVPVSPKLPVLVDTPVASRLNHVSIVNCAAPKPGAGPNVT